MRAEKLGERIEVAAVRGDRIRRQPSTLGEVRQESGYVTLSRGGHCRILQQRGALRGLRGGGVLSPRALYSYC
jgi:hypothetical protein